MAYYVSRWSTSHINNAISYLAFWWSDIHNRDIHSGDNFETKRATFFLNKKKDHIKKNLASVVSYFVNLIFSLLYRYNHELLCLSFSTSVTPYHCTLNYLFFFHKNRDYVKNRPQHGYNFNTMGIDWRCQISNYETERAQKKWNDEGEDDDRGTDMNMKRNEPQKWMWRWSTNNLEKKQLQQR